MDLERRTSRVAGWFMIATFVTSIPAALVLYEPVLKHHDYIVGGGADKRIALGAFLEILLAVANIGTAVTLYPITKRQNESMALGYVTVRVLESTVIVVGLISLLSVVTLRHDLAGTSANAGTLTVAGRSLVAFHDWTFLLGPGFCSALGNGLLLGYLMFTSGLVPRRLALLGLIGGPLLFFASTAVLFGAFKQTSAPASLLALPEAVWELSFGIYLVVKGFKPCPILEADSHEVRAKATPGAMRA